MTSRWTRFLTIGLLGFLLQVGALATLTSRLGWTWLPSTIVAVELAVVHNFVWHARWTWRDRPGSWPARFVRFQLGNGAASIAGNAMLMALFAGLAGLPAVPANILSVATMSVVNFLTADRWVFPRRRHPEKTGEIAKNAEPKNCFLFALSALRGFFPRGTRPAAIVCAVQGRPFIAVMSRGNSEERARMMRALGAEVILVEQAQGSTPGMVSGDDLLLVEKRTTEIARLRDAFRIDQFVRLGNSRAHELHTGPEIYDACAGSLTGFCDFAGTGGSFAGLSKAFKARNPAIKAYMVEPAGAAVLQGERASRPNHRIQGGGYAMAELGLLKDVEIDGFLTVSDEEAIDAARRLAREEGIFAGFSSGANVAAALKLLRGPQQGGTIAVLICDSGLKYLSTDLWL